VLWVISCSCSGSGVAGEACACGEECVCACAHGAWCACTPPAQARAKNWDQHAYGRQHCAIGPSPRRPTRPGPMISHGVPNTPPTRFRPSPALGPGGTWAQHAYGRLRCGIGRIQLVPRTLGNHIRMGVTKRPRSTAPTPPRGTLHGVWASNIPTHLAASAGLLLGRAGRRREQSWRLGVLVGAPGARHAHYQAPAPGTGRLAR
jgi:hypothetical protein